MLSLALLSDSLNMCIHSSSCYCGYYRSVSQSSVYELGAVAHQIFTSTEKKDSSCFLKQPMRWAKVQKLTQGNTEEVVAHKILDGLTIINVL